MQSLEKKAFIKRHKLPHSYLEEASIWFDPLVKSISEHQYSAGKPIIVGIHGCQGSGKTTLADYLAMSFRQRGQKSVALSIDDFYLDHQQRQDLAGTTHPLLATRGVPGTHDLDLALNTLIALQSTQASIALPEFDKATDNKTKRSTWPRVDGPIDIVILEGWCLGIPAQSEAQVLEPINELESKYDADGTWRHFVNKQLSVSYLSLWRQIDTFIMLKAPEFECVYQWRLEQEEKLLHAYEKEGLPKENRIMSAKDIAYFIQHFERLSRHALEHFPAYCEHVYELDENRRIKFHHENKPAKYFE